MSQSTAVNWSGVLGWTDRSIRWRAVVVGATVGVLVNLSAMVVPLFAQIGGGIVAGLIAGYWIGGVRGWVHGLLAGIGAGVIGGWTVAFMGALISMYLAPPLLVLQLTGQSSPVLSAFTGPFYLGLVVAVFITVDAIVGGFLGATVRSGVDHVIDR